MEGFLSLRWSGSWWITDVVQILDSIVASVLSIYYLVADTLSNPFAEHVQVGNFTKHWNEFQVLLESPEGSMKIESNQPVKIEIPYLLHDLIWFEVSSFWSPSNKTSWLHLQLHSLHLCLLCSGSTSSSFVFFWFWNLPNISLAPISWLWPSGLFC